MSNAIATKETVREQAKKVDEIAKRAGGLLVDAASFAEELEVAQAIVDMRLALTNDLMAPVMALMNTDLGFRTDKDPKQKDTDGKFHVPYSVEVVRDVFIEARFRGFRVTGNEFNIIGGRFYAAKNGLRRKVREWPSLSGLKETYEGLRMVSEQAAFVKASALWKVGIVEDSIPATDIPVRVNKFMGPDGILGKAERKLLLRIYKRLTGSADGIADGDADEGTIIETTSAPGASVKDTVAARAAAAREETK